MEAINLFTWKPCRNAARFGLAALVGAAAVIAVSPVPASAANGIAVAVVPEFPTRVQQGSADVPASLHVVNGSSGAEATGSLTITDLTLVPSCGNFSPTCSGGADPGLFSLSSTGTGAAGTNCAGQAFSITVVDPATGRVRFNRADGSPLVLAGTDITTELDTCRIHFSLSNLKLPGVDSYPNLAEPQTNQVGYMTVRHSNGSTGSDQGEDVTTIVAGSSPPPTSPPTTPTTTAPAPTTTVPPTTVAPTTTVPPATAPPTTAAPTTTTTVPPSNNLPSPGFWQALIAWMMGYR